MRDGHLVFDADRDRRIFLPIFEQHEAAARLERGAHATQHLLRLRELVIDVDQQHQIDRSVRQFRVVGQAEDRRHVGKPFFRDALLEQINHLGLDVFGVDAAGRADAPRHLHAHVAGARADIRDRLALFEVERVDGGVRFLFDIALLAVEPVRALPSHDAGVPAPADRVRSGRLRQRADYAGERQQQSDGQHVTFHMHRIAVNVSAPDSLTVVEADDIRPASAGCKGVLAG